ncbi:Transcriptional regulatory protein ZraR [Roseovarius albus]|uniref:Transcriptional regulatory protein ZraR n=1 Tax=Roseovarius albus TaxID=1247867 RepID=A0A1X7A9A2_9RHOB|nr:response regulator [Roseovarius albus]SLN73363.1 Transcriptional regulatory protein ZraR [Roseovarius albus]
MPKILLVDDEPDAKELFRQNFRREIRKNQYEFMYAQSGQEALEILVSPIPPDVLLVLSDINMPGMSGLELLDEVKSRAPDLPVIMVTAYGDKRTETEAIKRGARGLVSKPVNFEDLKNSLTIMVDEVSQ